MLYESITERIDGDIWYGSKSGSAAPRRHPPARPANVWNSHAWTSKTLAYRWVHPGRRRDHWGGPLVEPRRWPDWGRYCHAPDRRLPRAGLQPRQSQRVILWPPQWHHAQRRRRPDLDVTRRAPEL